MKYGHYRESCSSVRWNNPLTDNAKGSVLVAIEDHNSICKATNDPHLPWFHFGGGIKPTAA